MRVGIPKEVKDHEYRVGMTPAGVHALVQAGHQVSVQAGAGTGSGITDDEYIEVGAGRVPAAQQVWAENEMIVKVKEPVAPEYDLMQEGQTLFTYLHLAPLPELTQVLLERKVAGVAYETITDKRGGLPLLSPMSEVAGRMSVLVGAYYLQGTYGGRGTLVSGVPGVPPGDVMVIGGGIVGLNAAKIALGLGSRVTILETNLDRMRELDNLFHGQVTTLASNQLNLIAALRRADVLIGAVLIPGASAPQLVTRAMLAEMKPGAVVVDVAVDQGGCSRPPMPRPIRIRSTRSTASSTTVSPTCRVRSPAPRRLLSTTPPCPTPSLLPTKGWNRRSRKTPASTMASTPTPATSPASR